VTSIGAQGLNVPDLILVILYGVPQTIINLQQRKGWPGHTPGMNAPCLMIAEPWACSTPTAEALAESKPGVKQKRTEPAAIQYATTDACRWKMIMDYSGDKHPDGKILIQFLVLPDKHLTLVLG
jgi:superfamily II DNA helicase RecQ